ELPERSRECRTEMPPLFVSRVQRLAFERKRPHAGSCPNLTPRLRLVHVQELVERRHRDRKVGAPLEKRPHQRTGFVVLEFVDALLQIWLYPPMSGWPGMQHGTPAKCPLRRFIPHDEPVAP